METTFFDRKTTSGVIQVNCSKQLYESNTVEDTRYILSFNDNEQVNLMVPVTSSKCVNYIRLQLIEILDVR